MNNIVKTDELYSSELNYRTVTRLADSFDCITVESAGKSVAGSELYVMKFGGGEKQIFINASHHANEWITTPVVLKFTEDFLNAVEKNENLDGFNAAELFENVSIYIMPMVNPDGVDLVNGFFKGVLRENAEYIAQNYSDIPFPSGWKANILGTDLNLNYPAGWVKARRLKYAMGFTSPAPRDFVGYYPLSAPESKAVYEYTLNHDFSLILAYHTQGNIIYWKYDGYDPNHSEHIGKNLSEASGYSLELTPENSANAGYKDWFIKNYNRPGYTVECGIGVNPLPLSDFDGIYSANRPLILSAINSVYKIL